MKKKIVAIILSAALAAMPTVQSLAEDIVLDFEIEESDHAGQTYESSISLDTEQTELLFSVEEVDNLEQPAEIEVVTEVVEAAVSPSGSSIDASAAEMEIAVHGLTAFDGCYGNQLDGAAREVYDAMVRCYVQEKETGELKIKLNDVITFQTVGTVDENGRLIWNSSENAEYQQKLTYVMQAAYDAFIYDHPEIFWMDKFGYKTKISFSGSAGSYTGTIAEMTLTPTELYTGAAAEADQFEQRVAEVSSQLGLSSASTKYEIVSAIHNYLCEILTYEEGAYAHSPAGVFLKDKRVVCEGYAKAFQILCNRHGVACILVVGNVSGAHMWNYVQMEDGNWYLVDVTWDDRNDSVNTTYLLAGSSTIGYKNIPIAQERSVYTNFSSAVYTQQFALPILSDTAYSSYTAGHTHEYQLFEEKEPTCQETGYSIRICSICQMQTKTVYEKVEHSFVTYQSNLDANFHQNGTKTAVCEYGCGAQKTVADANTKVKLQVSSLTLQKNQKLAALQVIGLPAGVTVRSWKSSNTKILKVSKKGALTAGTQTGTAKLTVTIGNGSWTDSKTITVKVQSKAVQTTKIAVNQKTVTLQKGKKYQIHATVTPISGQKVSYTSLNKKIAVVSDKGVVTAKAAGTAKITVKSGSKKCTVTIKVPQVKTTKLKNLPAKTVTLKKGKTKQLNIKVYPSNSDQKITYKSSASQKVTVSAKGKLTAKKVGTVTITVKSGSVIEKFKVTVKK